MSGHTPGPWQVERSARTGQPCVMSSTAWICGQIDNGAGMPPETAEANAALIAAAPDLLEICREFVRRVEAGEVRSRRTYAAMKAAIAKATGESA